MRTGLSVSALAHVALIALAVMGLGMGKPLDTPAVESIAVDLVPMTGVTNIRMGSLDSTVVETEAPSAVDAEKPAELAQPTGNTDEDQTTPQDNPTPSPAPTEQTAPVPVPTDPEPEPEPAVEPAPAAASAPPPPADEPTPEPDPAAEPPATPDQPMVAPDETVDPADAAPRPVMKTASLDQKRAEFKKQQDAQKQKAAADAKAAAEAEAKAAEDAKQAAADAKAAEDKKKADDAKKAADKKKADEQKRIEQAKADAAAKAADEVANLINNEESRGATTGEGGQKTLGREDGRSATLSKSEIDGLVSQIRGCLNVPAGASDAGITAQLEFSIDGGGMVTSLPRVVRSPASALEQAFTSAAQRAVMRCGPYAVTGQDVRATFDPREF